MTLGPLTKATTIASLLLVGLMLPFQYFFVLRQLPSAELKWALGAVYCLVGLVVFFAVAFAPRAVRVGPNKLLVERLSWRDFELPLREVTAIEEGPPISMLFGRVSRVAGNGGVMGVSGLFHVSQVGLVRCWATRVGTPTVLVRRAYGTPLLLGVDDPAGLMRELRLATRTA